MPTPILNLTPLPLWTYFYDLSQIPRPSKHEEQIQAYMVNFAKNHQLTYHKDNTGNIIIQKPATLGSEQKKGIILQAHLDMVPQKNSDKIHDFTTDPLDLKIEGDWVTANGTTLGADNGIGAAAAMAILTSNNINHGPIEALFTADEETGMTGAMGLCAGQLKGDILINLDNEYDDELCVGCAGGLDVNITTSYTPQPILEKDLHFQVQITGLKGGHSGMDINLGRGNAVVWMCDLLHQLQATTDIDVTTLHCGSLRNAIPREAVANICIHSDQKQSFIKTINSFTSTYAETYPKTEPDMAIKFIETSPTLEKIPHDILNNLVDAIRTTPVGPLKMNDTIDGLVDTSNNIASIQSEPNRVNIQMLVRSSNDHEKTDISNSIKKTFTANGFDVDFASEYPGWQPNPKSEILQLVKKRYIHHHKAEPKVKAIHAGLECGILAKNYPHWDMISLGPNIRHPHSPDEKVSISSVKKFWDLLTDVLENAPEKT